MSKITNKIFPKIFPNLYSPFSSNKVAMSTYSSNLLSLWNASTPPKSIVGPQIVYSVVGNQPDADGNMAAWPVNHPGKGVMVTPAYAQMLQNSKFEGAVSGTPGILPTNWILGTSSGTASITVADLTVGKAITYTIVDGRIIHSQIFTAAINSTYRFDIVANCDGVLVMSDIIYMTGLPANSTLKLYKDGVEVIISHIPAAGQYTLSAILVTTDTAGNPSVRIGAGVNNTRTGTVTISKPQLVASPYQMPYAASGAGATTSVTSTAATSGGNGLAIPLNAAMTAALCGGAFTAAALCWMGVRSAEMSATNDEVVLSVRNANPDLLYCRNFADYTSRTYDGTTATGVGGSIAWSRGEIHLRVVQTNVAKTQYRVGYRRYTSATTPIDANIVWGSWTAYDGSMNPLTHLRFGYNLTVPIGFLQTQLWNKSASDAEILSVLEEAIDNTVFEDNLEMLDNLELLG